MSNIVCLETERARRMTKPLNLIVMGIDGAEVLLTITHESGQQHTIRMSPAKAECFACALQALADAARAEGTDT